MTLLVSWVTHPLRIQLFPVLCAVASLRLALNFPYVSRYHLSPLWGLRPCYKHAAPLGLNATHQNSRHGIHGIGLVTSPNTQCVAL